MTTDVPCAASQALLESPLARGHGSASLQRQLQHRIREAILEGRLAPGSRLPGTRALAQTLAISRNTATLAYEHLAAEGFVQPDRQGTRVASLSLRPTRSKVADPAAPPAMARRLAQIRSSRSRADAGAVLQPGVPALSHFPSAAWRRALERAIRRTGPAALGYGDPAGEPALRDSVARHLSIARGVHCDPAQIVITEGAQEALSLCVRLLSNPGDTAWVEDPGYRGAKTAFHAGDLRVVPMRVDAEGLAIPDKDWDVRAPRLIYATPSHQYPGGAVLTVARRLALIARARRHGAWIIEDDYDSEFRHAGEPIGATQGLVAQAPVLYVGTFSKTMFPSLRLGFLVVPAELMASFQTPLDELLRGGHRHEQLALSEFIESGEYSRHLGRMRRLYRDRQQALRAALTKYLRVPHTIDGGQCGMHLTVRLSGRYPDQAIAQAARRHGMAPSALSGFAIQPLPRDNGLVLGYGNTPSDVFESSVQRLAKLARNAARSS